MHSSLAFAMSHTILGLTGASLQMLLLSAKHAPDLRKAGVVGTVAIGDVTFELEPKGTGVLLTVTDRRLPDRSTMLKVSAGWHMHLDVLADKLAGRRGETFWDGWLRLKAEYERRLGDDA